MNIAMLNSNSGGVFASNYLLLDGVDERIDLTSVSHIDTLIEGGSKQCSIIINVETLVAGALMPIFSNGSSYSFYIYLSGGKMIVKIVDSSTTYTLQEYAASSWPSSNYQFILVYDGVGSSTKMYVNGNDRTFTGSSRTNIDSKANNWSLGFGNTLYSNIKFYYAQFIDKLLTSTEVTNIYNDGVYQDANNVVSGSPNIYTVNVKNAYYNSFSTEYDINDTIQNWSTVNMEQSDKY